MTQMEALDIAQERSDRALGRMIQSAKSVQASVEALRLLLVAANYSDLCSRPGNGEDHDATIHVDR